MDIGSFVGRYYIDPIVYNEGYNAVNTLTYAIILGISLFAILKLMAFLKLKVDERLIMATSPFIILGASLRNLEDVHLLSPPLSYMFITPLVYVLAFLITLLALLVCLYLERSGMIGDYSKPFFWAGIAGIILVFAALLLTQPISVWWAPIVVVSLAFTFTGAIYLLVRHFKIGFLTMPMNVAILGAHMFDASSTFTAIDIVGGFAEKHVVPVFFIGMFNTAFIMYALKLAVFIPVVYLIERYFVEEKDLYYVLKFVLLVLGFGPGIRNTLELVFVHS
ncbi:putative membrane protein [Methanocella conradii HZ254]|uniref:Membrane protein n=1 Tax=Methanocella conradii (strain DSM 24694 / JCM 17849 / CGMCC 1.5162 / HZ254) TaxID=1041930 RepID=H8I528_METCZ|nr:DUF63 family protein [Methanocella conradii]AFC98787.1 putative membrane protein [Methanocella conradii HZ254]